MQQLTFFRILSYILVPIAIFLGLLDFLLLLSALANPPFLLPVFLIAGFCIYVFASLLFLTRSIDKHTPAKASMKDWIRVNAFVSLFLGFTFLLNSLSIFYMGDNELRTIVEKFLESQPNIPSAYNATVFIKLMRGVAYFLFCFSFILLIHISICFKILKQYAGLFLEKPSN